MSSSAAEDPQIKQFKDQLKLKEAKNLQRIQNKLNNDVKVMMKYQQLEAKNKEKEEKLKQREFDKQRREKELKEIKKFE